MMECVVRRNGHAIALVHPATIARSYGGGVQVVGPLGVSWGDGDPHDVPLPLLAAVGALIPGSSAAVTAVAALLEKPAWSRTISYLLGSLPTADKVLATVDALSCATVAILGCGGIGSMAAMLCAGLNVRKLILVDDDRIEASNLHRQLFWRRADCGRHKAMVLAEQIDARFGSVTVAVRLEKPGIEGIACIARESDRLLFCGDEPLGINAALGQISVATDTIILSAGYSFTRGYIEQHDEPTLSDALPAGAWSDVVAPSIAPSYGPLNVELAGRLVAKLTKTFMSEDSL